SLFSPYTFPWDTTTVSEGSHSLKAQAKDAAGNVGSSGTITVTVDNVIDPPPPTGPAFYIKQGANGDGSSWASPFGSLADAKTKQGGRLVRGAAYYVADGTYSGFTFDTPEDGTKTITIKKATAADHGAVAGWDPSDGDGQAVFTDTMTFTKPYYIFDGQVGGGPGSWDFGHGFVVSVNSNANEAKGIRFYNPENDGDTHDITVSHTEVNMNGKAFVCGQDAIYSIYDNDNIVLRYNYIHDTSRTLIVDEKSDNWIIEYSFLKNPSLNSVNPLPCNGGNTQHSEMLMARHGLPPDMNPVNPVENWVIRYNVLTNWRSTGGLIFSGSRNWEIYGNVFSWAPGWGAQTTANGGAIGSWTGYYTDGHKIYHNTFFDIWSNQGGDLFTAQGCTNCDVRNNLWYNVPELNNINAAHSYNAFFDSAGEAITESNKQVGTGDPMVARLSGDYRLKQATSPGAVLGSPYNVDMFGNTRGADDVWDRGALEYTGNTPPPPSYTLTVSATHGSVTKTPDQASYLSGTVVSLAATPDAGYSFTGWSGDLSGSINPTTITMTSNKSVTAGFAPVPPPPGDTTPPTVSLTSPSNGATVSGPVTVTATASDNVGVTQVDFLVDGNTEFSSLFSPYTFPWDTTTVSEGSHSLKAQARDAAGNVGSSGTITVTVDNVIDPPPPSGLVLALGLNEDTGTAVQDSSGQANHGTVLGATWTPGKYGSGLSLNGTDSYLEVPHSTSLGSATNQLTVSMWLKFNTNSNWNIGLGKVKDALTHTSPYFTYSLQLNNGTTTKQPRFWVTTGGSGSVITGSALNSNQWYHVAGVYTGSNMLLYINGTQAASGTKTGN
ncbi:MAG: hypothetical protein HYY14_06300, partial [Candidatus Omnitrophica bacterium]|nr:hypothetical protein [Candidatus Omnitrophota bacterium]